MAKAGDSGRGSTNHQDRWVAIAIFRFDRWLQRLHGVFEYSTDPSCVWRIQFDKSDRNIVLGDGTIIPAGASILNLHLWNEHVPPMPTAGPTIGWARRLSYKLDYSLQLLSEYMSRRPEYAGVAGLRINLMVGNRRNTDQLLRIMGRQGFEAVSRDVQLNWAEHIHRYIDNFVGFLLCFAVNRPSARGEVFQRVRSQVLLSRRLLDQRYGNGRCCPSAEPALALRCGLPVPEIEQ